MPEKSMLKDNKMTTLWVVMALLAASAEPIIVKLGYRGLASPWHFLVLKNIVAALFILPLTRTFRWVGFAGLRKITVVSLLLLITSGATLLALKYLSAVTVITVVTTTPALVAIINQKLGRDSLTLKFWFGFLLCWAGVFLTVDVHQVLSADWVGTACMVVAVLSSAIYRVRMEDVTAEFKPMLVSTYLFPIMAIVSAVFIMPFIGPIPTYALPIGAWIGFAAALANVAFLMALYLLGSTRVSIINMLQRPLIVVAASIILKEPMTIGQILGIAMVFVGVQFATVKRKPAAVQSNAVVDKPESAVALVSSEK